MKSKRQSMIQLIQGGGGGSVPVNLTLPFITGTTNQGDTQTFNAGTWSGAVSAGEFRVIKGTVAGPSAGPVVLLDWTTATTGVIAGISDGDYLYLQERATGPSGLTAIATASPGQGPMHALVPADASLIGSGGTNVVGGSTGYTLSFTMDIATGHANKGFILYLHSQTTSSPVTPPTWSNVKVGGVPLTFLKSVSQVAGGTRGNYSEVWVLWGSSVPEGVGLTVTADRSTSNPSMRGYAAAECWADTQSFAPSASDVFGDMWSATSGVTSYSFNQDSTPAAKKIVVAFPTGQIGNFVSGLSFTMGTGWVIDQQPWPGARATTSLGWCTAAHKLFAAATANFVCDYTITESGANTERYGWVPCVIIHGDNSI